MLTSFVHHRAARHEDLDQNGLDGSVASSFWFQGSDEWYDDAAGHGTHVAGTIAAVNNTIGVVGVAPEAELFAVKYFADDSGFAYSSSLVNSAYKCRDAGAKIITMSLGGPLPNPFEFLVFDKLLRENGILSFAAAGNGGGHRPSYPASYNGVISVAAVDRNKAHASFSQRHRRVDISAPGVDVLSLLPSGGCTECNVNGAASGYGTASGTSMATPHVAGVAALLWSFKPEATATEILRAIEDSAVDLGDVGRDDYYGHGLVNAKEALIHLNGGPLAEPAGGLGVASSVAIQRVPTTTSSSLENECDESEVPFGLTIKTDFYGEETSWELIDTLDPSNVVLSGADFEDSKTYEWHKCIPANCYTFVIKDSAEDGLCCDYGSGSYSVSFGGQEIAKSDGVFASRQAVSMGYCDTASANLPVVNVGGSSEPVQAVDATPTDPDATTDEDCVEIGLTFTTDTFPKENRFELVKLSAAGSSPEKIWDHSSFSESETYEYSTCQDPAGCYEFILWDSFGDGLCFRYGDGSFKLSYDGDIVEESDGSFGHKVQVELGSGC
ncbi:Thermostable alkaline protease [Seminavis robusta]|uniref:subtilisin n=1 Tax=Seminavis robusta TaxID=568900 RepID=A0A9N8EE34_9STRA|nr:Thermostable alkaline protease [Seminavis robusta]|eukprot:Sro861_g212220.1 Thermostable alkaline protease (554) ;mRNA; f:13751-15629